MKVRHGGHDLTERPYECEEIGCHKAYASEARLAQHVRRVHEGFKGDYICATCSKPFYTPEALEIHSRWHTGERPFACTKCSTKFANESDYRVHMRMHAKDRPFKCEQCGSLFTTGTSLRKHMNVHVDVGAFACAVCARKFAFASIRDKHQMKCTGGE